MYCITKYRFSIVHNAGVVIGHIQVLDDAPRVLLEVVLEVVRDVLLVDLDVLVTVRSRLLVVQTQRVSQLVNHRAFLNRHARQASSCVIFRQFDSSICLKHSNCVFLDKHA